MPVPSSINDLSTTAGSNSPAGSENPNTTDDYLRALSAFIAINRDAITGKEPADATILKDADIGSTVQAYDADTLKADTADVLTVGYAATPYNAGTKSTGTYTPDEANGNFQYCVNGGAFTLAPPTNNCTLVIQITNNASAGTITTSGFTKVTGTAPTTTNGDDFLAYITKINGFSHLAWQALQ